MDEWLITYRGYTEDELIEEIDWLKVQTRIPFESQAEENRQFTRNTAAFRDRLAAATTVRTERSGGSPRSLIANFSR